MTTDAPAEALSRERVDVDRATLTLLIEHVAQGRGYRRANWAQRLDVQPSALARAEAAEAEVKRLREAGGALADRWDAEYMTLGPEHDYEESGGYLKAQGDCADELRAALAGSPS